ncbi:MAG TPA: butyrate kinase [bacterium]|nr:butyrate kinase [bacterium]
MTENYTILVINPGSTSDEISLFKGMEEVFHKTVRYSAKAMEPYESQPVTAQFEFRSRLLMETLEEENVDTKHLDAIIGRGGLLRPIPGGTYAVNEAVLRDLKSGEYGDHPSNLGGILAHTLASDLGIPAFIADPVVVDEMHDLARLSGMPENPRVSIFHALNQKRVARLAARELGKKYNEVNLIVMHGGGGISIGAHKKGRVIDVNQALDGDGPYTPQRSGGVPGGGLLKMAFSGKYTLQDLKLKMKGKGGLIAYLGTSDLMFLENYLDGKPVSQEDIDSLKPGVDKKFIELCLQGMAYQIAKDICAMGAVLHGDIDGIVLTGGIIYDQRIKPWIIERIEWMGKPIFCYPGGDEMASLRDAAIRALNGSAPAQIYN